jgi:hypothetical protein
MLRFAKFHVPVKIIITTPTRLFCGSFICSGASCKQNNCVYCLLHSSMFIIDTARIGEIKINVISPIRAVLLALMECFQGLHNILGKRCKTKCQRTTNGAETNCLEIITVKDNQFALAQASMM